MRRSSSVIGLCSVAVPLLCLTLSVRPARAEIYFQGTDNKLWRLNTDGTGGVNLGGYKTKSAPVVFGGHVYFQGTDDALWQILPDGTGGIRVGGGYKTSASPFVASGIYFRGTDDKLWRVDLDGSNGMNLGGYKTKSTPQVSGRYVFFQGTDNKLWRINLDGSGGINLGLNTTSSPPFVTSKYVYFRGTDDRLLRTNLDGTSGMQLSGYKTKSTPFVTDSFVYFQGTDDKLWRINLDGSNGVNLGRYKTKSSPVIDTAGNFIYFQGTDNALWRLNLDGSRGTHLGGFNTASTPGLPPTTLGMALPKYVVLTLIYAPPGTNAGKSASLVDYSNGSSTGTTLSISSSLKEGVSAALTYKADSPPGGSFGISFSDTTTNDSSLQVKKSASNEIKVAGPGADGIDHDHDVFYLWLNPRFDVSVDPHNNLDWQLGVKGPIMTVQYVLVGELKNPALMNPGKSRQLAAAGLTTADYAQILALDPCASAPCAAAIAADAIRFLPTSFSFPYNPPFNASDSVPTVTSTVQNSVIYDTKQTTQTAYGVALNVVASLPDKLGLKLGGTLDWTNTGSTQINNTSSQSATVTVGGPAFGYTAPGVDVLVYWDTIYNSFVFTFTTDQPNASGVVMDRSGKPASHVQVTLGAGAHTFTTFTDAKGEYRFYHAPSGQGKLAVKGEHFAVPVGPGAQKATLHLTTN
jgi:plastocyanin